MVISLLITWCIAFVIAVMFIEPLFTIYTELPRILSGEVAFTIAEGKYGFPAIPLWTLFLLALFFWVFLTLSIYVLFISLKKRRT